MVETIILKFWEIAETSTMRIGLSLGRKSTTTNLSVTRTLEGSGQVNDIVQIKPCLVADIYSCKLLEV